MVSLLAALAEAVADGDTPDWTAVDGSSLDAFDRARLEELRAVSAIGRCLATVTMNAYAPAKEAPAAGTAPTTWRGLTVMEPVGEGRFGSVYRAWDPATDRHVALKLLRPVAGESDPDQHVVQEARLMGRVRHPNVATIFGAARHEGWTGLWMEFIEGRTLEAELREGGLFDAAEAARAGVEICRALGAVHQAGLVHRDVKAQNVLREKGGRIVLGDFGTGLEMERDEAGGAPMAGTPLYLAPELWEGRPPTPQSDVYSLGVLLFHLVTGSFPLRGRSAREIRIAHRHQQQTSLRTLAPTLPAGFIGVVERALARSPEARYATAHEMEMALMGWLSPPPTPPTLRHASIRKIFALGLAAAIVGIIVWRSTAGEDGASATPPGARGASQEAVGTSVVGSRRLHRVPAPAEAQFWGQPAPDGRTHTFVDMDGDLGLFETGSGALRVLTDVSRTGGFAYQSSTFSPAGDRIAYGWETVEGWRELRVMGAHGGAPHTIWRSRDEIAHPVDWSGGRILAVLEQRDGQQRLGVLAESGSPVTVVARLDAGFSTAQLSDDGRRVLFDALQQPASTDRDIYAADVEHPGQRMPVVAGSTDDFGPQLTAGGTSLIFVSDRTGEPSVWSQALTDTAPSGPVMLQRNIGRITPNGLTADGTFYYRLQVGLVDIYQATFGGAAQVAGDVRPLAPTQVGSKINAAWSPDGRALAYVALPYAGAGSPHSRRLAIADVHAGPPRLLEPPLSYYLIPRWSPDGRTILVKGADLARKNGIYLVDAATGAATTLTLVDDRNPADIGPVQWGADGRTVLFTRQGLGLFSLDLHTRRETLVFDFISEGIVAMTPMPGFGFAPDGHRLAYSAYRRGRTGANETVLRVKAPGASTRDLIVGRIRFEDWTADGNVLFTRFEEGQQMTTLWSIAPEGGAAVPMGLEMHGLRNVNVHPDGRRIAFTAGFPGSEVWALANFLP